VLPNTYFIFIETPLEDTLRLADNHATSRVGLINFYNYMTIRHFLQSSGLEVLNQRLYDTLSVCPQVYWKGERYRKVCNTPFVLIQSVPDYRPEYPHVAVASFAAQHKISSGRFVFRSALCHGHLDVTSMLEKTTPVYRKF
jgi:hypothetical protein